MPSEKTEDLVLGSQWCARLADMTSDPREAEALRQMSRDLGTKARGSMGDGMSWLSAALIILIVAVVISTPVLLDWLAAR